MTEYKVQSKNVGGLEVSYTEHVVVLVDDRDDVIRRIAGFRHLTCARGLAAQLQEAFEDGVEHSLSVFKEAAPIDFKYPTFDEGYEEGYEKGQLDGYWAGRTENTKRDIATMKEFFAQGKDHAARVDKAHAERKEDPIREYLPNIELCNRDGERS